MLYQNENRNIFIPGINLVYLNYQNKQKKQLEDLLSYIGTAKGKLGIFRPKLICLFQW